MGIQPVNQQRWWINHQRQVGFDQIERRNFWRFNGDLLAKKLTQLCFLTHESRLNFATTPFVIFQFAMLNCQSAPSIKNWEPSEIRGAKHQHPEKQKDVQWIGWKTCRKPTHLILGGPMRAISFFTSVPLIFQWVKLSQTLKAYDVYWFSMYFPCIWCI